MFTDEPEKKETSNHLRTQSSSRALSTRFVRTVEADRTYFLTSTVHGISNFISSRISELYNSLSMTFSLESVDYNSFKNYIWPAVSSGAALVVGEYVVGGLSQYRTGNAENDSFYKLLFGSAILSYCVLNRITEKKFKSTAALSAAVASEVVAITYMYSSVFDYSKLMFSDRLSDNHAFVASLGTTALFVPGGISYLTQKAQELLVRYQYSKGAQRSDSAVISSGMTPVSNLYFQLNHFLAAELMTSSRIFQLALIADNILNAELLVQKFRNLPALLADLTPATIKKLLAQQEKLEQDYIYNNTLHRVLKFTPKGSKFIEVPRYQLRRGDLVLCDDRLDLASVPLSGELIALEKDTQGYFTQRPSPKKFSVNLKAQNGEDVWIEYQSKLTFSSTYRKVDLHTIRDGKQPGVLVGDQLNLYGNDNIFIQIMPEKELLLSSGYEKKSVINQIISDRKQKSVLHSILASAGLAVLLKQELSLVPAETLRLMFGLFQTMIPFSEAFLRDSVNNRLMAKLNQDLADQPFETIDALRIVDLCNALNGYYADRFVRGVAIISDKTGTLTTNKMDVLTLWTRGMPADVTRVLVEHPELLVLEERRKLEIFELFLSAYTNSKEELEPEEFALLAYFKALVKKEDCLQVSVQGNNHFKKQISFLDYEKEIETMHLGLYRTFGGRLTLVDEGKNKYLVFCGIPKPDAFKDTPLLAMYAEMDSRIGVLSRDWCIARTPISEEQSFILKNLFSADNKKEIEAFIKAKPELLKTFTHSATFIINNPVKKSAELFIPQCKVVHVPVFVATGDTAKAAENIARVLCPASAKKIITIHAEQIDDYEADVLDAINADATVIFAGLNPGVLALFNQLLTRGKAMCPVIIFAEMSIEGKGLLARFLKQNKFFVVANGDGTNDVMMMKNADLVIAHHSDKGTFAPKIGPLSNLSDTQLRRLFKSDKSFYDLFDIHNPDSLFMQRFTPLANTQEKPTLALALKSSKMSFELARAVGASNVRDMPQQHWCSVAFDLMWLWVSFYEINQSTDLPMDNQNIGASNFVTQAMGVALAVGITQSLVNYVAAEESTNFTTMLLMLSFLPLVLRSIFSGFKMVQDKLYPAIEPEPADEAELSQTGSRSSVLSYMGAFFRSAPRQVSSVPLLEHAHTL